jgi:hypothetical protein
MNDLCRLNRRAFIRNGSLFLLSAGISVPHTSALLADEAERRVRLGLVTDRDGRVRRWDDSTNRVPKTGGYGGATFAWQRGIAWTW